MEKKTRQTRGTAKDSSLSNVSPVLPRRGRPRVAQNQRSTDKSPSDSSTSILEKSGMEAASQNRSSRGSPARASLPKDNQSTETSAAQVQSTQILVPAPDSSTRTFRGTVVSSQDGKAVKVRVTPSRSVKKARQDYMARQQAASSPMDHNYDVPELAEWKKRMQKNEVYIDKLKKDKKLLGTKVRRANKKIEKLLKSLMLEQKMHNETQQTLKAIMQSLKLEVVT